MWGKREIIYLSLQCHHENDSSIKMGSDESHFNVSVESDGQSHKTVSGNHNLFEEKGQPKRYRTEVLPLTSLTPWDYRPTLLTRRVRRFGLTVRLWVGKPNDLGSIPLRFSFLFKKVVVCYTMSCDFVHHFLLKH